MRHEGVAGWANGGGRGAAVAASEILIKRRAAAGARSPLGDAAGMNWCIPLGSLRPPFMRGPRPLPKRPARAWLQWLAASGSQDMSGCRKSWLAQQSFILQNFRKSALHGRNANMPPAGFQPSWLDHPERLRPFERYPARRSMDQWWNDPLAALCCFEL